MHNAALWYFTKSYKLLIIRVVMYVNIGIRSKQAYFYCKLDNALFCMLAGVFAIKRPSKKPLEITNSSAKLHLD